jgi:hypothetical protein
VIPRPNSPLPEEEAAFKELEAIGSIMLSRIGEGHPENPLSQQWGVFHGSHGGYGRRLRTAMERSLKCCGLGAWWRDDFGKGALTRKTFDRIAIKYLGGSLRLPEWKRGEK